MSAEKELLPGDHSTTLDYLKLVFEISIVIVHIVIILFGAPTLLAFLAFKITQQDYFLRRVYRNIDHRQ